MTYINQKTVTSVTDVAYTFKVWTPTGIILTIPSELMPEGWQAWDNDLAASAQQAATHLGLRVTMERVQVSTADPETCYVSKDRPA